MNAEPVASSANGLDDRVRQSHIDPRLLIVDQQPKSGYAGLFCRGTSFQIPRGRVGRFPYYQINAVSRWGAYTGTAAGVRVSGTVTEGEEITVSDFYRSPVLRVTESSIRCQGQKRPRVPEGTPRGGRKNEQCDMLQLRHLVMRWKGFDELPCSNEALARKHIFMKRNDAPDLINCVAVSYLYIRTVRPAIYPSSRLMKAKKESQNQKETYKAVKERERRQVDSRLFRALSRYYRLERKMEIWNRPQLLREGKHGHGRLSHWCRLAHLHSSSVGGFGGPLSSSGTY